MLDCKFSGLSDRAYSNSYSSPSRNTCAGTSSNKQTFEFTEVAHGCVRAYEHFQRPDAGMWFLMPSFTCSAAPFLV